MTFLPVLFVVYCVLNIAFGDQCAIGALSTDEQGDFRPSIVVYNLDDKTLINWSSEPNRRRSAPYSSIGVDHTKNILYAAEVDGTLWKYDITTEQGGRLGRTRQEMHGLVFNKYDGFLYGMRDNKICQITVTPPITTDCSYGRTASVGSGLMISKDGTYFYYVDRNPVIIRRVPFNNPTAGGTETVINVAGIIYRWGFTYAESIAWLNDDPTDYRVVLGCDNVFFKYGIVILDIYTGKAKLVRRDIGFLTWVSGIEPLYNDYDDCDELVPPNEPNVCPCYININSTIKFDSYECCDVGIALSSCAPDIEYGLKEKEKTCYVKENGEVTISYGPLSDKLYYLCESELLPIVNKYGANVVKTDKELFINKFKGYFSFIVDGKEVVSPYLIASGIVFAVFMFGLICLIGYCFYTCFCQIKRSKNNYYHLNTPSEVTTSDTNTDINL